MSNVMACIVDKCICLMCIYMFCLYLSEIQNEFNRINRKNKQFIGHPGKFKKAATNNVGYMKVTSSTFIINDVSSAIFLK